MAKAAYHDVANLKASFRAAVNSFKHVMSFTSIFFSCVHIYLGACDEISPVKFHDLRVAISLVSFKCYEVPWRSFDTCMPHRNSFHPLCRVVPNEKLI